MNLGVLSPTVPGLRTKEVDFNPNDAKVYFGPGFGPATPPLNPDAETFPASREHELPEIAVKGEGPWTYLALLAALAGTAYVLGK